MYIYISYTLQPKHYDRLMVLMLWLIDIANSFIFELNKGKVSVLLGRVFFDSAQNPQIYILSIRSQKTITEVIMKDLIISCNVPLSLFENPSLRTFMSVVDARYWSVSQSAVVRGLVLVKEANMKLILEKAATISITVEIWADRSIIFRWDSSFHEEMASPTLVCSCTLSHIYRIPHQRKYSDNSEHICDICEIKHKLDYIFYDNEWSNLEDVRVYYQADL